MEHNIAPPRAKAPEVLFRGRATYKYWLQLYKQFRKPERFGLGEKIDSLFLEVLELIYTAIYLDMSVKIPKLELAILKLDRIKLFSEISWENKLILTDKYAIFLIQLQEIGRQLSGWKKSLITKTSPLTKNGEENK